MNTKIRSNIGAESVPLFGLPKCERAFSGPLSYLFSISLRKGKFPTFGSHHLLHISLKKMKKMIFLIRYIVKLSIIPKICICMILSML